MAVWTLKMNIIGKPDVFNFCKTEKLIGFGWGFPDDYLEKLEIKEIQEIKKYDDLRKGYSLYTNSRQLTTCINAFKKMRPEILFGHWVTPKIATTYVKSPGGINT